MVEKADMQMILASRFQVEHGLPEDMCQLLEKLVDVPPTRVTPVKRTPRNATEVTDAVQPNHVWRRRA